MNKKTIKNTEFNHFHDLSNEWWKSNGKFKILHRINHLRINYIKNNIIIENTTNNKQKILKGINILDLGCGGGLICEPLAKLGANVTGIDFVKENIEVAIKHSKVSNLKIKYLYQDLKFIDLRKKYDVILILEVIEHINEWKNVVKKVIQNLNPGGKLILSSINRTILSKVFAIFLAEQVLQWIPKNTHHYNKFVKPSELISYLKKKQMKIIDLTGLVYNPFLKEWNFNKNLFQINYFCTAQKIS